MEELKTDRMKELLSDLQGSLTNFGTQNIIMDAELLASPFEGKYLNAVALNAKIIDKHSDNVIKILQQNRDEIIGIMQGKNVADVALTKVASHMANLQEKVFDDGYTKDSRGFTFFFEGVGVRHLQAIRKIATEVNGSFVVSLEGNTITVKADYKDWFGSNAKEAFAKDFGAIKEKLKEAAKQITPEKKVLGPLPVEDAKAFAASLALPGNGKAVYPVRKCERMAGYPIPHAA